MAFLEVFDVGGSYKIELANALASSGADALVVGRHDSADIAIADHEMSRRHLELRPIKDGWAVEDLGSTNGTQLNGDELMKRAVLHNGDELRIGSTVISYRDYADGGSSTGKAEPAPAVTKGEYAVLKELCRKYFSNERTKDAATREEMAAVLFVGEPAIQAHLSNLYLKFDIDGARGTKRRLLAEAVMDRGVITRRDYRADKEPTST